MNPQALIDEMAARRNQRLERSGGVYRQDHPRASAIGDCAREIYHQIKNWDKRPKPNLELQGRFNRGNEVQNIVVRDLLAEGWAVLETELPFEHRESLKGPTVGNRVQGWANQIICTGHSDLRLAWNGMKPVGEIKSLNPNVYNRVNEMADFRRMGSFWTRYTHQLPLYCYAQNPPEELGLFILDDCMGHRKAIPMVLEDHLDECEEALQLCRAAKVGVLTGEPPPHCTDPTVCTKCWAREAGLCFPPINSDADAIQIIDDAELAQSLARHEEIIEPGKEYNALDKAIKGRMKAHGAGEYVAGDFLVRVKAQSRRTYNVPDEVKQRYADTGAAIVTTWTRIVQPGGEAGEDQK